MAETVVKLRVEGMSCGSCVARVEGALQSVEGVRRARVNLTTESAAVELSDGTADRTTALIAAVRAAGYDAERARGGIDRLTEIETTHAARLQQQRQAMVQAIGLAVPIIVLEYVGPTLQSTLPGGHVWWRVLQALLCTMLLYSPAGGPILVGGLQALVHRTGNMDLLISLGVVAAYVTGVASILLPAATMFHFHAAAMILAFINVGRYFESRARRRASGAVAALARRLPKTALRLRDGKVETVPIDLIEIGDRLRVADDTVVPVDGTVVEGSAAVDQSMMTGEPIPVARRVGEAVYGGSVVREGTITIEATALGEDSAIGGIVRAVEQAQAGKTSMQRIADRVAGVFVPIVVVVAAATLVGWITLGHAFAPGVRATIAVLVIACPCAMGLATPTAVLVATSTAALRGILVRDAAALEAAGRIDTILLDKTGTVTSGQPQVTSIVPLGLIDPFPAPEKGRASAFAQERSNKPDADAASASTPVSGERGAPTPEPPVSTGAEKDETAEREALRWAASAEQFSQHPLARAIVAEAKRQGLTLSDPATFESEPGFGVSATVDGRSVLVGGTAYLKRRGIDASPGAQARNTLAQRGQSAVWVVLDGVPNALVGLSDSIRDSAQPTVAELNRLGLRVCLITGDQAETAAAVASSVGIDEVFAGLTPAEKSATVQSKRRTGGRVAFVGDGINDAPALAAADVGIALAAGTDVANAAAHISLVSDDLTLVPAAIRLARSSARIIRQNLFWAFAYNVAAIPLAATGRINPAIAAAAMMMSSISVVLNSLRLARFNRNVRSEIA